MKKVLFCLVALFMLSGCGSVSQYSGAAGGDSTKAKMHACLLSDASSRFQAGTLFTQGITATAKDMVKGCMQKLALQSMGISQESQSMATNIIQQFQNYGTAK